MSAPALPATDGVRSTLRRVLPWDVTLSRADFERRQAAMVWVLVAHVPVIAIIGVSRGWTALHTLVELSPVLLFALASSTPRLNNRSRMVLATTGLVICSSLLIHATGGLTESHFHFFAVVAVATLYQAWAPFLVCLFWVVFHHMVVGVLDPTSVYNHEAAIRRPVLWAFVHAAYVLLASAAAIMSWKLTELASQRSARLLEATSDGVYGRDGQGLITFVNAAAADAIGRDAQDMVGQHDHTVFGHEVVAGSCALCTALDAGDVETTDVVVRVDDARSFPAALSARRLPGSSDELAVTFRDVTQQREHEAELERMALEDPLTGLPNRTLLLDRLQRGMASLRRGAPPFAVLAIDLDRFKEVNDTLGHAAGDELLCEASARLVDAVREVDTVARLGGDEFIVLLGEVPDLASGMVVAERIRASLSAAFWLDGTEAFIGASCGLRLVQRGDTDADLVLREADTALYASKRRGRGRVTPFDEALGERTEARFRMANELHTALDDEQFELHHEPMVDQATLEVVGFEALVRWDHPSRGLLGPEDFAAAATETNLSLPLGSWALERAVEQLDAWHRRAPDLGLALAVRLDDHQLRDRGLLGQVYGLLEEHDVPPEQLWLQVSEAAVVQQTASSLEVLTGLRGLGVTVVVDEFGTGYSSLAAMRSLPVDVLKISPAVVAGLADDEARRELVRAVVGIAEALDLRVVTAGVATPQDLAAVHELLLGRDGRHLAQGPFFADPMRAEEAAWLVDEEARQASVPTSGVGTEAA